jgi:acyl-[acyl-carrier-protein] desaturase
MPLQAPEDGFPLARQIEVLRDMEAPVAALLEAHESKRRLWWPSDLIGAHESDDPDRHLAGLRERARGIPDAVRVSLVMGMVTEEGLPHFHRLIAVHMGDDTYWRRWNNLWTAEEDRHGAVLHDYLWEARIVHLRALEELQFQYILNGFHPGWEYDPYRLLAYTSLQERATQVCHINNSKAAAPYDPVLTNILERIGSEEARHFHFYRQGFAEILKRDPNLALESLANVVVNFEMPGNSMPGFREMTDVIRRAGIYGPEHYLRIVEDLLEYWRIAALTSLDEQGRKAQELLLGYPARLRKILERMLARATERSFQFDVVYGREFSLR